MHDYSCNGRFAACGVIAFLAAAAVLVLLGGIAPGVTAAELTEKLCRIEVRDAESNWPVPLVEMRTVHHQRFVSDNAGVIAFDLPECFDQEIFFYVLADGYEVPADGFGFRGVRLTPRSGQTLTVRVKRTHRQTARSTDRQGTVRRVAALWRVCPVARISRDGMRQRADDHLWRSTVLELGRHSVCQLSAGQF